MKKVSIETIKVGDKHSKEYVITDNVYQAFCKTFGDENPLHIDVKLAQEHGFKDKVMHGGILAGFVSEFVGMHFPGPGSVIHSIEMSFRKANYLHDKLSISAEVTQVTEAVRTVVLTVAIQNLTQNYLCAKAKLQVGVL